MNIADIAAKGTPKSYMNLHEDPSKLHIGTLPDHSYFIPFAKGQDAFALREGSKRFELLNGEWDFAYFESIIDLPDDFTEVPGEKLPVPSNWQLHGYDRPQENGSHYGCTRMTVLGKRATLTFRNPEGFSFNASEYTQEELAAKKHNFELRKSEYNVICADFAMAGVGSAACGPRLADQYRIGLPEVSGRLCIEPRLILG